MGHIKKVPGGQNPVCMVTKEVLLEKVTSALSLEKCIRLARQGEDGVKGIQVVLHSRKGKASVSL